MIKYYSGKKRTGTQMISKALCCDEWTQSQKGLLFVISRFSVSALEPTMRYKESMSVNECMSRYELSKLLREGNMSHSPLVLITMCSIWQGPLSAFSPGRQRGNTLLTVFHWGFSSARCFLSQNIFLCLVCSINLNARVRIIECVLHWK